MDLLSIQATIRAWAFAKAFVKGLWTVVLRSSINRFRTNRLNKPFKSSYSFSMAFFDAVHILIASACSLARDGNTRAIALLNPEPFLNRLSRVSINSVLPRYCRSALTGLLTRCRLCAERLFIRGVEKEPLKPTTVRSAALSSVAVDIGSSGQRAVSSGIPSNESPFHDCLIVPLAILFAALVIRLARTVGVRTPMLWD
jgi:hypothetical protein